MTFQGDLYAVITDDGMEFHVPDEDNRFLVAVGFGAPPIEYQTRRSYKQHGETKVDYTLSPRAVTVQLWKKAACSRIEYWENRAALHDLLRPNRGGSLLFVLTMADNVTKRAIYLDPNPGAQFNNDSDDDNNWSLDETLEFIAFNPVWFGVDAVVSTPAATTDTELVFPITFDASNIIFGLNGLQFNTTITYNGTWVSYPIITLTGPYNSATLLNVETGVMMSLNVAIAAGEQRIITLTPSALSIVDGTGADKFGDLGPDSDLVDFNIRPHPEVPGGVQTIQAIILGGTAGQTAVSISYYERYYAI